MATSLADTSGTVAETIIDVTSVIEHAVRRCGVSAAEISAEIQASARENLFFILSNLATRGLSLWCVQKMTIGMTAGKIGYALPPGTVDVLRALLRRATRTDATAVGAGVASVVLGSAAEVGSALVTPEISGTYNLVLEYSLNGGANWSTAGTAIARFNGSDPIGVDANLVVSATDWRVRDERDPLRVFDATVFLSEMTDLQMSKLARDDYVLLPDKTQQSDWPLQFWYDKQFYEPLVHFWPVPNTDLAMRIYTQSQIQDPGRYTNAVQVPQRWLDAVISLLAPRVCLELPKEKVPPDRYATLESIAAKALADAEDSETDGAPIRLAPNISYYTR